MKSLKKYLGNVKNKTFLDIGCGSGLFSYSISLLGAKDITSFDVDPFSVQCTEFLRSKIKSPQKWSIFQGSILDKNFISKLGKFDIVYAWGVLHHTGRMWDAIRNAISLVKDNGLLYIAIYNKTKYSKFWLKIKKFFNRSPKLGKNFMNFLYYFIFEFNFKLIKFKNPFKNSNLTLSRGMTLFIDIKDWMGGYPYEFATFGKVKFFVEKANFKLNKYKKVEGEKNNEFLFKKISKT